MAVVACMGTLFTCPQTPTPIVAQGRVERELFARTATSSRLIFPGVEDTFTAPSSVMLANFASPEQKPVLTEEEEQAKAEARQKGLAVVLLSALPSVWAQDQLVWKKERQGIKVFGDDKDKQKNKKAGKR